MDSLNMLLIFKTFSHLKIFLILPLTITFIILLLFSIFLMEFNHLEIIFIFMLFQ